MILYSVDSKPGSASTNVLDVSWDKGMLNSLFSVFRVSMVWNRDDSKVVGRAKRAALAGILKNDSIADASILSAYRLYYGKKAGLYVMFGSSEIQSVGDVVDGLKKATGRESETIVKSLDINLIDDIDDTVLVNLLIQMVVPWFSREFGRDDARTLFCSENEVYFRMGSMYKTYADFKSYSRKMESKFSNAVPLGDNDFAEVWALAFTAKAVPGMNRIMLTQKIKTFTNKALLRRYFEIQEYHRKKRLDAMRLGLSGDDRERANPVDYASAAYVLDGIGLRRATAADDADSVYLPMVCNTGRKRSSLMYIGLSAAAGSEAKEDASGVPISRDLILHEFLSMLNTCLAAYGVSFSCSPVANCQTLCAYDEKRNMIKKAISDYAFDREFSLMLSDNPVGELTAEGFIAAAGNDASLFEVASAWVFYKVLEEAGACFSSGASAHRISFIHSKDGYRKLSREGLKLNDFCARVACLPDDKRAINLHMYDESSDSEPSCIPDEVVSSLMESDIHFKTEDIKTSSLPCYYVVRDSANGSWRLFSRRVGDMADLIDLHNSTNPDAIVQHVTYEAVVELVDKGIRFSARMEDDYNPDGDWSQYRKSDFIKKHCERYLVDLERADSRQAIFDRAYQYVCKSGYFSRDKSLESMACVTLKDLQLKSDIHTGIRRLGFDGDTGRDLLGDWAYFASPVFKEQANRVVFADRVDVMACGQGGSISFERMDWDAFAELLEEEGVFGVDEAIRKQEGSGYTILESDCPEIICVSRHGAVLSVYGPTDLIVVSRNPEKVHRKLAKGEEGKVRSVRALKESRNNNGKETFLDCLDGFLGVKMFTIDGEIFYSIGEIGAPNAKLSKAIHPRRIVEVAGQEINIEQFIDMLLVDFVRHNRVTVVPFPCKYIREWRRMAGMTARVESSICASDEDDEINVPA